MARYSLKKKNENEENKQRKTAAASASSTSNKPSAKTAPKVNKNKNVTLVKRANAPKSQGIILKESKGKPLGNAYDAQFTEDYFINNPNYNTWMKTDINTGSAREVGAMADVFRRIQAGENYRSANQAANSFAAGDELFQFNDSYNKGISDNWLQSFLDKANEDDIRWIIGDWEQKLSEAPEGSEYRTRTQADLDTVRDFARNNFSSFVGEDIARINEDMAKLDAQIKSNSQSYDADLLAEVNGAIEAGNSGINLIDYVRYRDDLRNAIGFDEMEAQYEDETEFTDALREKLTGIAGTESAAQNQSNADLLPLYDQFSDLEQQLAAAQSNYDRLVTGENYDVLKGQKWVEASAADYNPADYQWYEEYEALINSNGDTETRYNYNAPTLSQIIEDPNAVNAAYRQAVGAGAAPGMNETIGLVANMTEDEMQLYKALWVVEGEESAQRYFDFIKDDLYARETEALSTDMAEYAEEHPGAASAMSIATKILGSFGVAGDALAGRKGDNQFMEITEAGRGEVGRKIAKAAPWANVAGINLMEALYNVGMSGADMLASRGLEAMSGGAINAEAMLSLGAFADTYSEVYERTGGNVAAAWAEGLAAAGIEYVTERISWGALEEMGDISDIVGKIKYGGKAALTEGFEEGISNVGNVGVQLAVEGADSPIVSDYEYYRDNGYTPQQAFGKTAKDLGINLGVDVVGGTIMGGTLAGGKLAISGIDTRANSGYKGDFQQAIEEAFKNGVNSDSYDSFIKMGKKIPQSRAIRKVMAELEAYMAAKGTAPEVNAEQQSNEQNMSADELNQTKPAAKVEKPGAEPQMPVFDRNRERSDAGTGGMENPASRLDLMKPVERLDNVEPAEKTDAETTEQANELAEQVEENPEDNADDVADELTDGMIKGNNKLAKNIAAKIGILYREIMNKLDPESADMLRKRMSFNLAEVLNKLGTPMEAARPVAESILKIQDGSFDEIDVAIVNSDYATRSVLSAMTQKISGYKSNIKAKQQDKEEQPENTETENETTAYDETEVKDEFDAVVAEVEAADENKLVSDGEESTLDGETVQIVGVAPAEASDNGAVPMVKVVSDDGEERTVPADSIAYGTNDGNTYSLARYASNYGDQADVFFNGYQPGQDVKAYARAFNMAYSRGSDGRNIDVLKNSGAVSMLPNAVVEAAYDLGRKARGQRSRQEQTIRSQKGARVPVGKVDTSAIRGVKLNSHQRSSIMTLGKIAKALGINIKMVQSKANAKGKYTTDNGAWNADTRTMTLDIHAGSNYASDVKYALMDTAGHELTHYIKQFADSGLWNEYQDFVMSHLDTKMDLETEIKDKMAQDSSLNRDDAIEEIIAEASVKALERISEQDVAQLAESNHTLFNRIKKWFNQWVRRMRSMIREAFASGNADSNRFAKAMEDRLDEMAAMWNKMLVSASRNANMTGMQNKAPEAVRKNNAQKATEAKTETALKQSDKEFISYAHIDERDLYSVKDTHTELFSKEVEPVRIAYGKAAEILLDDLAMSTPGQKHFIWGEQGDLNVTGQKRQTSEMLADMKDRFGWTWEEIRDTLNSFIAMGDETNGLPLVKNTIRNRRMEVYLHEMLTQGYTTVDGTKIAPWQLYADVIAMYQGSKGDGLNTKIPEDAVTFEEYAFPEEYGDVKHSPRFYDVEVSDAEIEDNINSVVAMNSVVTLNGNEITFGDGKLQKTVQGYFEKVGGKAYNPVLGDVELVRRSIKNDIGHGMYPLKALTFYAVPAVIENGKIINYDSNWQGTGQKSYIIAAPIEMKGGDNKGEYWMGVVVKSNAESQRMYTHDVVAIKKESFGALKTGTNFEEIRYPGGNKASITTILQKLNHVKYAEDVKRSPRQTESPEFKRWFEGSKIINADGTPKVMYHGTPYGGFTVFKDWQYFTENPEYADKYHEPSASSIRGRYNHATNPMTYAVYLNVRKPFDTRDPKIREIWQNEFYDNYSRTPLSDKGLPDWTDGIDLVEFIEDNGYDYDAIILDEGAVGGYGDEVQSRGVSVVVRSSNQIKSATDNIGTFDPANRDINYQLRDPYSVSDRELLANALESTVQNVEDLNRLKQYKSKIGELNEQQQLLQQTRDRIAMLKKADEKGNRDEIIRLKNQADIYAKRIARADEKLLSYEAMAPIKALAQRQREAYVQEVKAKADERIRKYKENMQQKTKEKIQDIRAKEAAKRKDMRKEMDRLRRVAEPNLKEKYRNAILSDAKKLYTWITQPTNKAHVPEFLKKPLGAFIESIDASSAPYINRGVTVKRDTMMADALEKLRRALANVQSEKSIESGAQEYAGYIDLPANYLQELDELVGDIKDAITDGAPVTETPLMLMNSDQLKQLSEMMRILKKGVEQMNQMFVNARYQSAGSASNDTIDDMTAMKAKEKTNKALETINTMFNWRNATPIMAFARLGRGGKAIFDALQTGWDKMAMNSAELIKFAENAFTAKQAKAWGKEIKSFKLDSGETIRMTAAQAMSLYCLNKRAQAVGHLLGGGIRVSDISTGKGSTISQVNNYVLSGSDITAITATLTAEQKAVADKLQKFMNTVCTEWGNEISMKRFGYKMFTETNYFPIKTDGNNRSRIDETKDGGSSMFRLLNMSAMKPLTPKANNAIIIENIFDVFSDHASDIAKYNALALPILDYIKWYNYVEKSEVTDSEGRKTGQITTRSTQKALEHAYGQNAKQYLMNFIKDLNAEHDGGRNDTFITKLIGNAKAASVGANLRVYFLQITSLPRAAYAINPKYLLKGLAKIRNLNPANAIKGTEAQEKVGILKWKKLGFYSTDIARNTRTMVRRDEGVISKIRDIVMKPAEWGDNWVSNIIYEAVKAEMKDKNPNFKPGTEAYDKKVNQRVREIVYKTQVVDSTMTRSDFMRSKGIMTLFTAFMSEPTVTANMLNEAVTEAVANSRTGMSWRDNLKSVGGKAFRALSVFAFSATVTAIMEALFDAMRDDDEYETFAEKFAQGLFGESVKDAEGTGKKIAAAVDGNIAENMNVFAMLPILSDAISILQGFEEDTMAMQTVKQFVDTKEAIKAWKDGKRPAYNAIYNMLKLASSATGVSAHNATRDVIAIWNTFFADAVGQPKVQTYSDSKSDAAGAYYEAVLDGDTKKAEWILERANINGYTQEDFQSKIATLIKEDYLSGEIDDNTARQYLKTYGGKDTNKANEQVGKWGYQKTTGGNYDDMREDYVSGSITASQAKQYLKTYGGKTDAKAAEQLDRWDYYKATGSSEGYTKYWKMYDAFENGGNFQKYARQWIDAGVDKGSIAQAIAGRYKEEYLAIKGTPAGDRMLERLLDLYEAIGYDRDYERRYITKNWK